MKAFALFLLLCAPAFADLASCLQAIDRGANDTALQECSNLAKQGSPGAQYALGVLYAEGKGVPQDYKEAARWFLLSADQGEALAQYNPGHMYDAGNGVRQD